MERVATAREPRTLRQSPIHEETIASFGLDHWRLRSRWSTCTSSTDAMISGVNLASAEP